MPDEDVDYRLCRQLASVLRTRCTPPSTTRQCERRSKRSGQAGSKHDPDRLVGHLVTAIINDSDDCCPPRQGLRRMRLRTCAGSPSRCPRPANESRAICASGGSTTVSSGSVRSAARKSRRSAPAPPLWLIHSREGGAARTIPPSSSPHLAFRRPSIDPSRCRTAFPCPGSTRRSSKASARAETSLLGSTPAPD